MTEDTDDDTFDLSYCSFEENLNSLNMVKRFRGSINYARNPLSTQKESLSQHAEMNENVVKSNDRTLWHRPQQNIPPHTEPQNNGIVSRSILISNQSAVSLPVKTIAAKSYEPLDLSNHLDSPQNNIDVKSLPNPDNSGFQTWYNDYSNKSTAVLPSPVSAVLVIKNNDSSTSTDIEKVIDPKLFTTFLNQRKSQAEGMSSNEVEDFVKWYNQQINSVTQTSAEPTLNIASLMATIERIGKINNTMIVLRKRQDQENTLPTVEVQHQAACPKAASKATCLTGRTVTLKLPNGKLVEIIGNPAVGRNQKRPADMECLSVATQQRLQQIRKCCYGQITDALKKIRNLNKISKMCDECCNAALENMF